MIRDKNLSEQLETCRRMYRKWRQCQLRPSKHIDMINKMMATIEQLDDKLFEKHQALMQEREKHRDA